MHPHFEAPLHDDEYVTPGKRVMGNIRVPDVPAAPVVHEADIRTRFQTPVERTPEEVAFRHVFLVARRDWERRLATLEKHADDESYPINLHDLEDRIYADDAFLTAALIEAHGAKGSSPERVGAYQQSVVEQRTRMHTVLRTARAMINMRAVRPDEKTAPRRSAG